MIDANKIASYLSRDFEKLFGHKVESEPNDQHKARNNELYFSLSIDQDFGIFSMVMKKASVNVRVANSLFGDKAAYWVYLNLSYSHHGGGSNGSAIGVIWYDEEGNLLEADVASKR